MFDSPRRVLPPLLQCGEVVGIRATAIPATVVILVLVLHWLRPLEFAVTLGR